MVCLYALVLIICSTDCFQFVSLDQGERNVAVQETVGGEVNPLFAALPQETLDLVAAVGE